MVFVDVTVGTFSLLISRRLFKRFGFDLFRTRFVLHKKTLFSAKVIFYSAFLLFDT